MIRFVVEIAENDTIYGNAVVIQSSDSDSVISLSGHLYDIDVEVGNKVVRGLTRLGKMGSTGQSTGAHLHQEFQYAGESVPYSVFNIATERGFRY